ncbi:MAG: pyridoxine 5'-phosphate synthase [Planctomycetota bacterium]|nr:pyridoxine 5'-phosphate synthase [Planctomycetota bacterium]
MIRLGVNIDHVATVRNARGEPFPEPVAAAHAAVLGGADQITVHLREDRRHIRDLDVELISSGVAVDLNLEMACTDEMIAIAKEIRPDHVCLVPERREEVTTEGGLDVAGNQDLIAKTVGELKTAGIGVSLFLDPDEQALLAAGEVGADAVELHTGRYANAKGEGAVMRELLAVRKAATTGKQLGMRMHAGHGLDYRNVWRIASLPEIEELNIGFAIVSRALFTGLTSAVREMRDEMLRARELVRDDL